MDDRGVVVGGCPFWVSILFISYVKCWGRDKESSSLGTFQHTPPSWGNVYTRDGCGISLFVPIYVTRKCQKRKKMESCLLLHVNH